MDCRIDPERGEEKKEEEREGEPRLLLLTNVENAAELRSMALATSGLALAKAALLPDLLQIRVAAAKACAAEKAGRMTTRAVSAETVYNLSSTKNIRDSLLKFGIDDGDRNLVAVIFDDENGEAEKRLTEAVRGDVERDPKDISRLTDWDLVAKAHKEKNVSDRKALTSLLISRTAVKDIVL